MPASTSPLISPTEPAALLGRADAPVVIDVRCPPATAPRGGSPVPPGRVEHDAAHIPVTAEPSVRPVATGPGGRDHLRSRP